MVKLSTGDAGVTTDDPSDSRDANVPSAHTGASGEPAPDAGDEGAPATAQGEDATTPEADFDVLVIFQMGSGPEASLSRQLVQDVVHQLGGIGAAREPGSRIDVWLESPGGDAHAAYKLGLYLRARYESINFVVIDYAKSAATLLCLAGDRIYMAPAAELGPLDTQENREGEIRLRSVLDTADSLERLFELTVTNSLAMGGLVLNMTGLTREKTIEHLLHFAGEFARPLLEQIDPIAVNAANTSLEVAAEYGSRLLSYRNGRDGLARARRQMEQLIRAYPTHGYVIDRDEARDVLDLPVEDVETYQYLGQLEELYSQIQKAGMNLVRLLPVSALQGLVAEDSQPGGETDEATDDSESAE